MNNRIFTTLILSFSVYLLLLCFTVIATENRESEGTLNPTHTGICARDIYVEIPEPTPIPEITVPPVLEYLGEAQSHYKLIEVTRLEMDLTYLGTYFITAYCPEECGGSWTTASGETCHRADWEDRLTDPTTCAIDRRYHSFGDTFYIEEFDRTFVAEDTGPGVQGYWLDLFYEDYDDVLSFPTGYYTVYSVEWIEVTDYVGVYEWEN